MSSHQSHSTLPQFEIDLFRAAINGDLHTLRFLAQDTNLECRDSQGNTPLLAAAQRNATASVKELIELGAKLDVKNNQGHDLTHYVQKNEELRDYVGEVLKALERDNQGTTTTTTSGDQDDVNINTIDGIRHRSGGAIAVANAISPQFQTQQEGDTDYFNQPYSPADVVSVIPDLLVKRLTANAIDTMFPLESCIRTGYELNDVESLIQKFELFFLQETTSVCPRFEFFFSRNIKELHDHKIEQYHASMQQQEQVQNDGDDDDDDEVEDLTDIFISDHSTSHNDQICAQIVSYSNLEFIYRSLANLKPKNDKNQRYSYNLSNASECTMTLSWYKYHNEIYLHIQKVRGEGFLSNAAKNIFSQYFSINSNNNRNNNINNMNDNDNSSYSDAFLQQLQNFHDSTHHRRPELDIDELIRNLQDMEIVEEADTIFKDSTPPNQTTMAKQQPSQQQSTLQSSTTSSLSSSGSSLFSQPYADIVNITSPPQQSFDLLSSTSSLPPPPSIISSFTTTTTTTTAPPPLFTPTIPLLSTLPIQKQLSFPTTTTTIPTTTTTTPPLSQPNFFHYNPRSPPMYAGSSIITTIQRQEKDLYQYHQARVQTIVAAEKGQPQPPKNRNIQPLSNTAYLKILVQPFEQLAGYLTSFDQGLVQDDELDEQKEALSEDEEKSFEQEQEQEENDQDGRYEPYVTRSLSKDEAIAMSRFFTSLGHFTYTSLHPSPFIPQSSGATNNTTNNSTTGDNTRFNLPQTSSLGKIEPSEIHALAFLNSTTRLIRDVGGMKPEDLAREYNILHIRKELDDTIIHSPYNEALQDVQHIGFDNIKLSSDNVVNTIIKLPPTFTPERIKLSLNNITDNRPTERDVLSCEQFTLWYHLFSTKSYRITHSLLQTFLYALYSNHLYRKNLTKFQKELDQSISTNSTVTTTTTKQCIDIIQESIQSECNFLESLMKCIPAEFKNRHTNSLLPPSQHSSSHDDYMRNKILTDFDLLNVHYQKLQQLIAL